MLIYDIMVIIKEYERGDKMSSLKNIIQAFNEYQSNVQFIPYTEINTKDNMENIKKYIENKEI